MNIRFHNLGKIKETELDLNPLTIIIGPNNSNKTYVAYSIYGLWQQLKKVNVGVNALPLQNDINGSLSITVDNLKRACRTENEDLAGRFTEDLESFYQDSSRSLFSHTRFEIAISPEEFETALRSLPVELSSPLSKRKFRMAFEQDRVTLSPTDRSADIWAGGGEEVRGQNGLRAEAAITLNLALRRQLFARPYLLPAERNAFVITYKVLANRRLKLMLDAQRRLFSSHASSQRQVDLLRESGEIRYPQPIEDFLEFLFDIESEISPSLHNEPADTKVPHTPRRNSPRNSMRKLASEIEHNIQNGDKIHFRATALGGQEIIVDVGEGLNIDLYNASSSIKQLAPLLLYLRYRAAKGDLLIIDEPEMNLHPESQAKLLEILAMLVNQGVYVLLTTHSPYIMAHLNNLAQTKQSTPANKKTAAASLYLNSPSSLLQMEQISAYEMKDSKLHSLKDPDYGFRWDTLSDVSTELQQRYFSIHG